MKVDSIKNMPHVWDLLVQDYFQTVHNLGLSAGEKVVIVDAPSSKNLGLTETGASMSRGSSIPRWHMLRVSVVPLKEAIEVPVLIV